MTTSIKKTPFIDLSSSVPLEHRLSLLGGLSDTKKSARIEWFTTLRINDASPATIAWVIYEYEAIGSGKEEFIPEWRGAKCSEHGQIYGGNGKPCQHWEAIQEIRYAEIREILQQNPSKDKDILETPRWSYEVIPAADALIKLYLLDQEGVFVGQSVGGLLYTKDVEKILELTPMFIFKVMAELETRKILTLNGFIIQRWFDREPGYIEKFKTTGHKRFDVGDFGDWYCSVCEGSGDSQDDPYETPCISDSTSPKRI
jgi:hypothetical protein